MTLSEIFAAAPVQPGREQRLSIAAITVPERLRPVDPDWVSVLAESMATIGMKEPIIVRYAASDAYELVAGAHRLAAAARLGWLDLPVSIEELDDLQARLVEIEENLIRRELSKLDRAVFLAEHKRIWEELHPETKHGKAPKGRKVAKSATLRFTAVATERTGLSERSVQQAIALADRLSPDAIKLIRGTYLVDHESDLQWLSRLRPDQQLYAAREVGERRAERVKDALPALGRGQGKGDEQERIYQLIAANLARASRRTREQVRDLLDQIDLREGASLGATTHITSDGGTGNGEAARQTPTENA